MPAWNERLGPLKTRCDESPYYQDYDRANDCADETSVLARLIPPDRLAKICCYNSSNYPEHGRQDKPLRLILVAGMEESRDHPCHKPNYDAITAATATMAATRAENNQPTVSIPALGFGLRAWCKSAIETSHAAASPSIK